MPRKNVVALSAMLAALLALPAQAESFGDRARVISSHPVHERIPVSREECWNERQRTYEDRRVTRTDTGAPIGAGTVLGAVVGGVIGHQFGNSSGSRDRATAAGAIVGGIVGHQIEKDQGPGAERESTQVERVPVTRDVQRCRVVEELREATVGYDVRYEYGGRQFTARLPQDPGRFLRVRVHVEPVEPGPGAPPAPVGPGAPVYR